MPKCSIYGAIHTGPYRIKSRAYFVCGDVSHITRDYPQRSTQSSKSIVLSTSSGVPSSSAASMRLSFNQGGRSGGKDSSNHGRRVKKEAIAKVHALT